MESRSFHQKMATVDISDDQKKEAAFEIRQVPSWTSEERKAYILDLVRMTGEGGGFDIDFTILDENCEKKGDDLPEI